MNESLPLRTVVVDDERLALDELVYLLGQLPDIEIVGQGSDGIQAVGLVEDLEPDVLFLDVQMPGLTGFEAARRIIGQPTAPEIVFVTAFDQYAVDAFAVNAVDYLLKPVDPARLARALQRLRDRRPAAPQPAAQRLVVSERGRLEVIDCARLLWLQAADNYVELYTAQRMFLLRRTLDGLLADLGPGFVRIHRSRAVALAAVAAVEAAGHGNAAVRLSDGRTLGCSRAWREGLQRALQG